MTGSRVKLTTKQQKLLDFLRDYITVNGWAPSIREMMPVIGTVSTSTAAYQLGKLVDKGWIKRGDGPRQIAILTDTEAN